MKKIYLLAFSLISMLSFSQQVLKRISDTSTLTKIELYVIRNGTNSSNVVGENNFEVGASSSTGTINFRNFSGIITYNSTMNLNGTFPVFPNEIVCSGTLESSTGVQSTRANFTDTSNSSNILNISVVRQDKNADILEDSNTLIDVLYSSFEIPKLLDDGNSIPLNTWAIVRSRTGVDLATGGDAPYQKRIGFKFNGTTWVVQNTDWNGVLFDNLQDVCDGSLSISEMENKLISIYPNPTNSTVNISSANQTIEQINVYDITGRLLKSQIGNNESEIISIQELPSAIYFLEVKTEQEIKSIKIIKQ